MGFKKWCALAVVFTVSLVAVTAVFAAKDKAESPAGKTYYTAVNIWYEMNKENTAPKEIPTTNYHKGAIIPINSKVTIGDLSERAVTFTTEDGKQYTIQYMLKHSVLPLSEIFPRYFSPQETSLRQFNGEEQANIKKGTVAAGMSKKAVLAAYGYPPFISTPSLESDQWKYWIDRFRNSMITFSNDKVVSVG
ncbi:MAG: hypothetical protein WC335_09900, partial [Candidatus Omnitrophota bacterium]